MAYRHVSVMPAEVRGYLNLRPGERCVDGTLGGCGHAGDMCRAISPDGLFIGIDQDRDAIRHARQELKPYDDIVHLFQDNFVHLTEILSQLKISSVDAILLDLGVSLHQLRDSGRGFSFQDDEPLDMRMDDRQETTAADLLNRLPVDKLGRLFRELGEERRARQIARKICDQRARRPIETSGQLAALVKRCIPPAARRGRKIHPATRVFMALRIAVNRELECLDQFLTDVTDLLSPGGRLCILAFHSLEDRIVKHRFAAMAKGCVCPPDFPLCNCGRKPVARLLTRKVVRPKAEEIAVNPMARSTRLRALQRL